MTTCGAPRGSVDLGAALGSSGAWLNVRDPFSLRVCGMDAPRLLTWGLAGLMCSQALLGLALPGAYRDAEPIRTAWFGNDWITLVVSVPLLVAGMESAARGSIRGLLLWLGMIAYSVYNYAFYLFGAALNAFFPLYVLTTTVATVGLILAISRLDVADVARRFCPTTPARAIGGSLAGMGTGLAMVWIAMWAAHIFAGWPTPVAPDAFKIVAALDLALMVPSLTAGGVLLWRRHPWGYLIASLASIQSALYLLVLSVNSVVAIRRGLASPPGELPVWGVLLVVTSVIALMLLANVKREGTLSP